MIIKPFKGLRPLKEYIEYVNVPPYDVVDLSYVKEVISNNKYSFFHITRSEAELPENTNPYSNDVYNKARENLRMFINEKILFIEDKPCFYLLTQNYNGKEQTGIYALVSCKEYIENKIKKHELTRKDKEEDRTNHIQIVEADTGPVFLFFKKNNNYTELKNKLLSIIPEYKFKDENNVLHKLRIIKEEKLINEIKEYFKNINNFYIADGHHRAASAANVWLKKKSEKNFSEDLPSNYFMAVIFPSDELNIYPYNRIVYEINPLSENEFINEIAKFFTIELVDNFIPNEKGDIRMFIKNKFYKLKIKNGIINSNNPLDELDVSILQNYIFSKILNITDPRVSKKIDFIGGKNSTDKIINKIKNNQAKVGFSLYPIKVDDLINICDNNLIMPPKSTWFEPKLRDGVITYLINN